MDELKVEIALEIIQKKIVSLLKSNKDVDADTAKETLKTLVEEREKIYNLDEETIEKVYTVAFNAPFLNFKRESFALISYAEHFVSTKLFNVSSSISGSSATSFSPFSALRIS